MRGGIQDIPRIVIRGYLTRCLRRGRSPGGWSLLSKYRDEDAGAAYLELFMSLQAVDREIISIAGGRELVVRHLLKAV